MRVLIVEDSGYMADALRGLLDLLPELALVGQTASRDEALVALEAMQPDIMILDLRIKDTPDGTRNPDHGMAVLHASQHGSRPARVLVLSSLPEQPWLQTVARAGALGFVSKESSSAEILAALQRIIAGGVAFTPQQLRLLQTPTVALSRREREVLGLLAEGLSNRQIAERLGISSGTARKHVENLCELFAVHNRGQVVAAARHQGLLPPDP